MNYVKITQIKFTINLNIKKLNKVAKINQLKIN